MQTKASHSQADRPLSRARSACPSSFYPLQHTSYSNGSLPALYFDGGLSFQVGMQTKAARDMNAARTDADEATLALLRRDYGAPMDKVSALFYVRAYTPEEAAGEQGGCARAFGFTAWF